MNSLYGRRGQICAHMHWTWDYLNHGISYAEICRIMADLPRYEYDKKDSGEKRKNGEKIKLTNENAAEVADLYKKMFNI